ncbi:hypothetical protein HELRODRAFT_170308 [Helobdella robusta]|uniref:Uncharacterized protein n=1 Tax=Helobdella robusta TaxID=6412 RepID=T1F2W8_HELRO|nr:hypothetical protein HELRODRAFT_170308 [Helobdella robusta]ESO07760.1 hypothetical protein HELRODRAFT_170308 [Helobdella robusta]
MEKDAYGMTPLLAAAVTGNTKIVEYLTIHPECSREVRVEALELLGSTYVDKKRDLLGAAKFWKIAITERYRNNVLDVLHKPKPPNPLVPAYNNTTEVESLDDLENILLDPDEMRMQSLLIRERILGPTHPDTSYYIRYRGAVYADSGDFIWCISLWRYALEMQQKHLEPLSPLTQSSFLSFAELFSFMTTDTSTDKLIKIKNPLAILDDLLFVFNCCINEIEKGMKQLNVSESVHKMERDTTSFNRYLIIILHLMSLTCRKFSSIKDQERWFSFLKSVYRLVRMKCRNEQNHTLLHLACSKETSVIGRFPVCNFPDLCVVKVLLEVGASCSDRDKFGNTALHLASCSDSREVIELLLKSGAHICTTNFRSQTASDMLKSLHMHNIVPLLKHTTLQCLASKVIRDHKIKYKGEVPAKLENFVELH